MLKTITLIVCNRCRKTDREVDFNEYDPVTDYYGKRWDLCDECALKGFYPRTWSGHSAGLLVEIQHEDDEE